MNVFGSNIQHTFIGSPGSPGGLPGVIHIQRIPNTFEAQANVGACVSTGEEGTRRHRARPKAFAQPMRKPSCDPQWSFTLIELLIAVGILLMSLSITLAIMGQAKSDLVRAKSDFEAQHHLEQVTEYYLMTKPNSFQLPHDLLPDGWSASCEVSRVDDADEPLRGWIRVSYDITVKGTQDHHERSHQIRKLVREEDLL